MCLLLRSKTGGDWLDSDLIPRLLEIFENLKIDHDFYKRFLSAQACFRAEISQYTATRLRTQNSYVGVIFSFSKMVKNFCNFQNFSIISEFDLNPAIKGRGLANSKLIEFVYPLTLVSIQKQNLNFIICSHFVKIMCNFIQDA